MSSTAEDAPTFPCKHTLIDGISGESFTDENENGKGHLNAVKQEVRTHAIQNKVSKKDDTPVFLIVTSLARTDEIMNQQ